MKKRSYSLLLAAALLAAGAIAMTSLGAGRAVAQDDSAAKGPGVTAVWDSSNTEGAGAGVQNDGTSGAEGQNGGTAPLNAKAAAQGEESLMADPALPAVENGQIIPANLSGAKEADQLIVVVGTGGCNADVSYYKKDQEGGWNLVWKEAGIVGRNGITAEKREGDGKTPAGTYGLTMAFGLKEDPGSLLPYHKIVKGDYWVDDSASPYYNKLINTSQTPKDWNSAENMAAASPYYNYALALDYNPGCLPGMGSAIFLHCFTASADNGSAGCIRLPEARAMELVQSATSQTKIIIAPDILQLH